MSFLRVACLGLLLGSSMAHADSDLIFDTTMGAAVEDRSGTGQTGSAGRVLVSIETIAHDNKRKIDYAWITGSAGFGLGSDGNPGQLASLDIHVTPATAFLDEVTDDCTDYKGEKTPCLYRLGIRIAPLDVHREVAFGLNGSVVIHAIGLQGELRNESNTRFLQVYVDTLGLAYMSMASSPNLFGMDLLHLGVKTKLTWQPDGNAKLSVNYYPLIAEVTLGFGQSGGDLFDDIPLTGQAFTRLEASFKTAFGQYSAYAEGGGQELIIDRPESDLKSDVFGALVARLGFEVRF